MKVSTLILILGGGLDPFWPSSAAVVAMVGLYQQEPVSREWGSRSLSRVVYSVYM